MTCDLPSAVAPIAQVSRLLKPWRPESEWDGLVKQWFRPDAEFYEIGDMGGAYVITDITPGMYAQAHIRIHDKDWLGRRHDGVHTALFDYLFNRHNLKRLDVRVPVQNRPAIAIAKRLGFEHEGVLKNSTIWNNMITDAWVAALTR